MDRNLALLDECRCDHFETGYTKTAHNRSYNWKDAEGKVVSDKVIVTVVFSCALLGLLVGCLIRPSWTLCGITVVVGLVAVAVGVHLYLQVSANPMRIVYAASYHVENTARTPPVLDVNTYFPEHTDFEAAFGTLKVEVSAVAEHADSIPLARDTFGGYNGYIGRDVRTDENGNNVGWKVLLVNVGGNFTADGLKYCPTLVTLLRKHSNKVMSCAISILPPQTTIPRHVGYYKGVMRYMLPIEVPRDRDRVYLCNNDQKILWSEGQSLLFDDTFPHKVFNLTDERRIVLYMDVLRPLKSGALNAVNRWVVGKMQESGITKAEVDKTEYLVKLPKAAGMRN